MDGYQGMTALIESAWEELNSADAGRRDLCLDAVSDVLETGRLAQSDVERTVERLVTVACSGEGHAVRESALHAICMASTHHELPYRVVEPLAAGVDDLGLLLLAYVLSILGCTHDQAALPIVERFQNHTQPEVRQEASEAVTELRWCRESSPDKKAQILRTRTCSSYGDPPSGPGPEPDVLRRPPPAEHGPERH